MLLFLSFINWLPSAMMLPFNTSAFSNSLGVSNHVTKRKAVIAPFDEFDAKPEDIMQHIAQFIQHCEETGIMEDFNFIESENPPRLTSEKSKPFVTSSIVI
jgi:hypothetical protein